MDCDLERVASLITSITLRSSQVLALFLSGKRNHSVRCGQEEEEAGVSTSISFRLVSSVLGEE